LRASGFAVQFNRLAGLDGIKIAHHRTHRQRRVLKGLRYRGTKAANSDVSGVGKCSQWPATGGLADGTSGQASIGHRIIEYKLFLGHALPLWIALRLICGLFPSLARRRQRLQRRRPIRSCHVGLRVAEIVDFHVIERTSAVFGWLRELKRQGSPRYVLSWMSVQISARRIASCSTL
jgi:hypothetical protein